MIKIVMQFKPNVLIYKVLLLSILLLGNWACLKTTLNEKIFFEVKTEIGDSAIGRVMFIGQLIDSKDNAICCFNGVDEQGFIWSKDSLSVLQNSINQVKTITALPPDNNDGRFLTAFTQFDQGETVFFRAFARLGARMMYGEMQRYKAETVIFIENYKGRKNDQAFLQGRISGLTNGQVVTKYGFVYSATESTPVLNGPDCLASDKGTTNDARIYLDTLQHLKFNRLYYVRAYAEINSIVYYSRDVLNFQMKDGWKAVGELEKGFADGVFASVESLGKAFGGLGCSADGSYCFSDGLNRESYAFQPTSDTSILEKKQDFEDIPRTNACVFSIGESVYVFWGEVLVGTSGNGIQLVSGCSKYNTNGWQYVEVPFDPDNLDLYPAARTGSAVFVLSGKAYIIGGLKYNDPLASNPYLVETNEVWQYDPTNNGWAKMAALPLQKAPGDTPDTTLGRTEAIALAFQSTNTGYAGGGLINSLMLKDFWRFYPPTPTEPLGRWELSSRFPQNFSGRIEAVCFAVGDRGYIGSGKHLIDGPLNDWWEFDPLNGNKWLQKESLPSTPRTKAFGFSLGNFGFLGGGVNGFDAPFRTIWRYEPENK